MERGRIAPQAVTPAQVEEARRQEAARRERNQHARPPGARERPIVDELEEEARARGEHINFAVEEQQRIEQMAAAGDRTALLYALVNRLTRDVYTQTDATQERRATVSLGYSEITLGSARQLFDALGVNAGTSFLDIGSGFGRLVFHAIEERHVPIARAHGLEYDRARVGQSRIVQQYVADYFGSDELRDAAGLFTRGDVADEPRLDYDVIFFYNWLNEASLRDSIHRILLGSRFTLYADCFPPNARRWPYLVFVGELEVMNDGGETHTVYVYRPRRQYESQTGLATHLGITEKEALQTADTRIAIARALEPDDWRGLYALQFAVTDTPLGDGEILAFDQLWRTHCYRRYGEALPRCLADFEGIRRALIHRERPRAIPTYWFVTFRFLSVLLRVGTLCVFALLEHEVWVGYPETRRLDGRGQLGLPLLRHEARRVPLSSYAFPSPPVAQSPFLLDYAYHGAADELQARVTIDDPYVAIPYVSFMIYMVTGDGGQTSQATIREDGVDQDFATFSRVNTTEVMLTHVGAELGLQLVFLRGLWANARIHTYVTQGLSLQREGGLDLITLAGPYDWLNVLARAALDPDADTAPETLAFMEQGGPMTFYYGGRRRDVPVLYQHTSSVMTEFRQ
jgi:SAM-dependent methyltransferase